MLPLKRSWLERYRRVPGTEAVLPHRFLANDFCLVWTCEKEPLVRFVAWAGWLAGWLVGWLVYVGFAQKTVEDLSALAALAASAHGSRPRTFW